MKNKLLFFVLLALPGLALGQKSILSPYRDETRTKAPPPGNMSLLPGYEHYKRRGIDSSVGEIVKKDGMEIWYDIGHMAGQVLKQTYDKKTSQPYFKEVQVNGDTFLLTWKENGEITATFVKGYANFFASAKTPEDFADFLLMVMTYGSGRQSAQAYTPGSPPLETMWGYTHQRVRSIDSRGGNITGEGGLTIWYDIGRMAANRAASQIKQRPEQLEWSKTQKIGDSDLLVARFKDGQIYATFVQQSANFGAEIKAENGQHDLVDFLMMAMTYRPAQRDN